MRKLLLSLLIFFCGVSCAKAGESLDFTAIPVWGQSRAQVLQLGTPGELTEDTPLALKYDFSSVEGDVDAVYYYFTDGGELGAVSVYYAEAEPEARQLEMYNKLKDTLTAKYGMPKYDFGPGEAGEFDANMAHMTQRHAVWDAAQTDIYLDVKHDRPYDGVFLHYTGTDYFEYR